MTQRHTQVFFQDIMMSQQREMSPLHHFILLDICAISKQLAYQLLSYGQKCVL